MPEDVVGKTDNDVFIPGDAARLIALKHKIIETGTEVREQLWLILKRQTDLLRHIPGTNTRCCRRYHWHWDRHR